MAFIPNMQDRFNILKSVNVIHIYGLQKKDHMIYQFMQKKHLQNPTLIFIKIQQTGTRGKLPQLDKEHLSKNPRVTFNAEKWLLSL